MLMTRLLVPFATPDVSALAKTLKGFLHERHDAGKPPPTHVELLNLLARSAGLRNFATLKARALATPIPLPADLRAQDAAPANAAVDLKALSPTARKTLLQFDESRRLVRLPHK